VAASLASACHGSHRRAELTTLQDWRAACVCNTSQKICINFRAAQNPRAGELEELRQQLRAIQKDLEDRQRTEALRDKAAAVLKEELSEMRRREKRTTVDLTYVKDVIVRWLLESERLWN